MGIPDHRLIPLEQWIRAIPEYLGKYKGTSGPLPHYLVEKADAFFEDLIATSDKPVLIHGDLHHDNVLRSERDEWLAIDPKGIAAERAYEVAAMIRNPHRKLSVTPNVKNILKKRIEILSEELGFEPERIRKWCFAQTVLSGVWNDGGFKGSKHAMTIAEVLDTLKL